MERTARPGVSGSVIRQGASDARARDGASSRREGVVPSAIHVLIALACDIAYLAVIHEQGNESLGHPVVVYVATYVAGLGTASIAAVRSNRAIARLALAWWAIAGSFATGVLGAFSLVMLPLIPAALSLIPFATRTGLRARIEGTSSAATVTIAVASAGLAVATLIGGLAVAYAIAPA
jgi:hypothetical protein